MTFLTAFMDGHWLAVFASWIWHDVLIAGTAGSWGIYTAAFGHAGLLWWCWAAFLLMVALICIMFVWATVFSLYTLWVGAWASWIFAWIFFLIGKLLIWAAIGLWHLGVWIWSWLWPASLWILKVFGLPIVAGLLFTEIHLSKIQLWENIFFLLYPGYFVLLFILFPAGWAIWYSALTVWAFWLFATQAYPQIAEAKATI